MLALLPTVFAPAVRGTLDGITTLQDISRLDYNQTLDINTTSGPYYNFSTEIYQFEHSSTSDIIISITIDAAKDTYDLTAFPLSVKSDSRQITVSPDASKYPEKKTELFLGAEKSNTQISALVHELYYLGKSNDTIFTYSDDETGEFNGAPVTFRRYDATNQYVCTS